MPTQVHQRDLDAADAAGLAAVAAIALDRLEEIVDIAGVLADQQVLQPKRRIGMRAVAHLAETVDALVGIDPQDRIVAVADDGARPRTSVIRSVDGCEGVRMAFSTVSTSSSGSDPTDKAFLPVSLVVQGPCSGSVSGRSRYLSRIGGDEQASGERPVEREQAGPVTTRKEKWHIVYDFYRVCDDPSSLPSLASGCRAAWRESRCRSAPCLVEDAQRRRRPSDQRLGAAAAATEPSSAARQGAQRPTVAARLHDLARPALQHPAGGSFDIGQAWAVG